MKNERLRIVLILTAASLLAALFLWSLTRDVDAQGGLCPTGDTVTAGIGPLLGSSGSCEVCCDGQNGAYWRRLPNWHSYCYPDRQPTATPTRKPVVSTPRPGPVDTPWPTAMPTATRTRIAPTSTAIAVTETPEPTSTRVNTPIATATLSPTDPVPATATAVVASTATATPSPAPATETAGPAVKPITTEIPMAGIAAAPDPGRACIPTHAGAPVRLCPTRSGSGWWIYDSATGQVLQDGEGRLAHVPFVERLPAGEAQVLFASKGLVAVLMWNRVVVSTRYEDGKAYVFSVNEGGRIVHWQW